MGGLPLNRPNFITPEQIESWKEKIKNDPLFPHTTIQNFDQHIKDQFFEACFAGFHLAEELTKLNCLPELITRIQFTAGKISFGRDPWEIHLKILEDFKNNTLIFEDEPNEWN